MDTDYLCLNKRIRLLRSDFRIDLFHCLGYFCLKEKDTDYFQYLFRITVYSEPP